ncbi:hypothetical protein EDD15DRAFT_2375403 [Pisolithus albus]|nr:hypothetical protein EDD15DRAFT_2375403 [Pisolithus albus]
MSCFDDYDTVCNSSPSSLPMSSSTAIPVDPESTECEEQHSKLASADVFPLSLPRWDANMRETAIVNPCRPFGMVIETMRAGHFFGRKLFSVWPSRSANNHPTMVLWAGKRTNPYPTYVD